MNFGNRSATSRKPLVTGHVDVLDFQGFHEAFGLGVVIGVADRAHGAA